MPQVLESMFEAFQIMLQTDNPLLLQSHPCFNKLVVFFIIYNSCKKRLQLNLGPITIPGYQGSSWITAIIRDHADHVINLDPEVENKNKNNLTILESLKLRDPSMTFEPERSAMIGVMSIFNTPLDRLRETVLL